VTYINQIESPNISAGDAHPYLGDIISPVRPWPEGQFLPRPEDTNVQTRFLIPSDVAGQPAGRMYVSASPAFRLDGLPIYIMSLVSRMIPTAGAEDMTAVWTSLDMGREWIVRGFKQLTTEDMQRYWNGEPSK
jgi:hypothetical protein